MSNLVRLNVLMIPVHQTPQLIIVLRVNSRKLGDSLAEECIDKSLRVFAFTYMCPHTDT